MLKFKQTSFDEKKKSSEFDKLLTPRRNFISQTSLNYKILKPLTHVFSRFNHKKRVT